MDEIVKQALAKWPSVPHCYGWLALDARGAFRMRDEATQQANLPGDIIRHTALLAFIYRNYTHDERGAWFFQNGPQRVYVDLETTPFVARTDPVHQFVLHDGKLMTDMNEVCLTEQGQLVLRNSRQIAMLDDRDLAQCLTLLKRQGKVINDDQLLDWLASPTDDLSLSTLTGDIPVRWMRSDRLASSFGFIRRPEQT
ncbi:MAG: DUF2946 family protein [Oxalobacteraceae bacterium]|jgi:hypothetical protein|nr:DUF2946 family protein [Oxalobacteraceae bacterium]